MQKSHQRRKLILVLAAVAALAAINFGPMLARQSSRPTSDGKVLGWGANNYGQIGNGSAEYRPNDPHNNSLGLQDVRQLALGLNHSLALTAGGKVYGWGSNQFGQIGQDTALAQRPVPEAVPGLPAVKQIAASQNHSLALDQDGTVWGWGLNIAGQLGNGSNRDSRQPVRVEGIDRVSHIAAGYRMGLALRQDGSVWAWGADCQAQSRGDSFQALVSQLAAGGAYADANTANTTAGRYTSISPEELCINEEVVGIKSRRPIRVEGLPPATHITAGFGHMMALDRNGQVWTWGCNTYGQIGNGLVGRGSGTNLKPAPVAGMSGVAAISAGYRHSLALMRDGSVWAWGHNFAGELGTGKEEDENPSPARVPGLPKIAALSAGHDFSLAVSDDSSLWGWGNGEAWQIDGNASIRRTAHRVWGLQDVRTAIAGGGHAAVITNTVVERGQ